MAKLIKSKKNFSKPAPGLDLKQEIRLTQHANTVLEERYLLRDSDGKIVETPQMLFARVARAIAKVEKKNRRNWEKIFYEMMVTGRFLPNSPTLMNAGKKRGQLSACYVLPVDDSLDSIFDSLKYAAKIHQSGGGTGFGFSKLRPQGSRVGTTVGVASGPVSFMKIFDVATETIKQGGARRGANMAVLRVDHPDILDFIESKLDQKSVTNFNISVGITDEFMNAVARGQEFSLKDPTTKKTTKTIQAKDIFDRIVHAAWKCGDPGLVFLDQMNRFNPTPQAGVFESTNPCGEQPLLAFESCNLGSLNLGTYWQNQEFQWDQFKKDIIHATRFLDNVIDANAFPIPQCEEITLKNRKIGLGIMGFADLLLQMGISYASEEAIDLGDKIMAFLNQEAKKASAALAHEKGKFPNWKGSMWQKKGYRPLRNATVSTVAPTGTISIIAGSSSGIEPIFSGIYDRNVLNGKRLREVHTSVQKVLEEHGLQVDTFVNSFQDETSLNSAIREKIGNAWITAGEVPVEIHVRMQAVFQKHCDSAVSKTINLPKIATVEDVKKAYLLAYELGCKGITVYRDQSRPLQVLQRASESVADGAYCPAC